MRPSRSSRRPNCLVETSHSFSVDPDGLSCAQVGRRTGLRLFQMRAAVAKRWQSRGALGEKRRSLLQGTRHVKPEAVADE